MSHAHKSYFKLILSAINQRNTIIDLKSYRDSGYICCVLTEYNYLKKVEEQSSASSPRFLSFCMLPVNMSSLIELSESRYLELIKGDATPKHELLYYINRNGKKPGIAISLNKADKLINDLKKNEIPLNKIDLIVFNVCTRRQAATKMFTSSNGEDEIQSYKKLMTHINDLKLPVNQKPRVIQRHYRERHYRERHYRETIPRTTIPRTTLPR
ncbi:unnamed protein product, partial [Didymodactylos carnosus]